MSQCGEVPLVSDFNFFDSILNFSPDFLYNLNLFDKNVMNLGSRVHRLCSKFLEYEKAFEEKQKLQNEFIWEIRDFFQTTQRSNDNEFAAFPNTISFLLGNMNHYETMLKEQVSDLFNELTSRFISKNTHLLSTRKSLQDTQATLDSCWKSLSKMQNISNIKDKEYFSSKCMNFFYARKKYQETLAAYITVLFDFHRNVRLTVFKTFSGYLLSIFGFFINCAKTFSDSKGQIDRMYDLINEKEVMNKVKNSEVTNKYEKVKPLVKRHFDASAKQITGITDESNDKYKPTKVTPFLRFGNFLSSSAKDIFNTYKRSDNNLMGGQRRASRNKTKQEICSDDLSSWALVTNPSDSNSCANEFDERSTLKEEDFVSCGNSYELYDKKDKTLLIHPKGLLHSPSYSFVGSCATIVADVAGYSAEANFVKTTYLDGAAKLGYLMLKDRDPQKMKFRRIFIILRSDYGLIYSQGYNDRIPTVFAQLSISSVKICRPSEIDRSFCFKLTLPQTEYVLQATSELEVSSWLAALNDGISMSLVRSKRSVLNSDTELNNSDTLASTRALTTLRGSRRDATGTRLLSVPGNNICADCKMPNPEWASINIGVIICIRCSGVHRSLGVAVSKVRSIKLDNWDEKTIEEVLGKGNNAVNRYYEANLDPDLIPKEGADYEVLTEYIKAKYIGKKFV